MLSTSTNYSLYSIPAMVATSYYPTVRKLAVLRKLKAFNNIEPRKNVTKAQNNPNIPPDLAARIGRMEGAHYNGLESMTFFGLAVLAANYAGLETHKLNAATGLFILSRMIYNYIYINLTSRISGSLRSLTWGISMIFPFYLSIAAAGRIASK